MNAREAAIQAARAYWLAQGMDLTAVLLDARQTPLSGSVWEVRATIADRRSHLLLVTRQDKHAYSCLPQGAYGYTIYAFSRRGKRPLALVEYEAQAQALIADWQQLPRYAQVKLGYLENGSARWSAAIATYLATKAQQQMRGREQRMTTRRQLAYAYHPLPLDPTPHPVPAWEDIAPLIWRQLDACGLPHSRDLDRKLLAFLEQQWCPDGSCLPFGYAWTHFQQMLLLPHDPKSALQVFVLQRWRDHSACFWFDGELLAACSLETLEAEIAPRHP